MPNLLISGPAGAAKSAQARRLLREAGEPTIVADFQSLVAALLLLERDSDGRYPLRPSWVLPLAEYTRRAVITGARNAEIPIIATNSDGDPERRRFLLSQLGEDSRELIVDPGEAVVAARLANPRTGNLDDPCQQAIRRWYGRKK